MIQKDNVNRFVRLLLDVGEGLLCSGADIRKIEETFETIGKTYGVSQMSAFVIPSLITISIQLDDDFAVSQSRRISAGKMSTNLLQLSELNYISHVCRHRPIPLDELQELINKAKQPISKLRYYVGSAVAGGIFAIFFGGNVWDGLVAVVLALVIAFIQSAGSKYITNNFALNFLCAFVIGLAAETIGSAVGVLHTDMILIGDIMLLIPGMALTLSVRDIIVGDTIAGSLRLIDSLFVTGALAFGFWLAHWVIGG